jgi:membrane protein
VRAFLRDLWRKVDQDDVLFLAGGVAFGILLAGVPFFLLLSAGLGYALGADVEGATRAVQAIMERLLPAHLGSAGESVLDTVLADVVRTRAVAGFWGAVLFVWFSTRLFAGLRSVMTIVFERRDRGYLRGKLWDVHLTVTSAALVTLWVMLSAWLAVSSGRVGSAIADAGVRGDVLSGLEYAIGRLLAVLLIVAVFLSLYRWLPARRTPWRTATVGALVAAGLFEFARWVFSLVIGSLTAVTLYSGTLGALIIIVFWTYYAAIIFVLGAEVAHATEKHTVTPVAP